MNSEKTKTPFIIKFSIAYCPSVTVQSRKLLVCGTRKYHVDHLRQSQEELWVDLRLFISIYRLLSNRTVQFYCRCIQFLVFICTFISRSRSPGRSRLGSKIGWTIFRIRAFADFCEPFSLRNFDKLCSFLHNFLMNWARKSRLLRFWSKFKELSNGHILIDVLILLGQAMLQNIGDIFFSFSFFATQVWLLVFVPT